MKGHQFQGSALLPQPGDFKWKIVGNDDFNADGKPDLIWQYRYGALDLLAVWYMNNTTILSSSLLSPPSVNDPYWVVVGTADVNRDGKPDLIWFRDDPTDDGGSDSVSFAVWYMNGHTRIDEAFYANSPLTGVTLLGAGDMNRDNHPDLIFRTKSTLNHSVRLMNGVSQIGSANLTPSDAPAGQSLRAIGDFNNDVTSDLLLHQPGANIDVWYMNGGFRSFARTVLYNGVPYTVSTAWEIVGPK